MDNVAWSSDVPCEVGDLAAYTCYEPILDDVLPPMLNLEGVKSYFKAMNCVDELAASKYPANLPCEIDS